MASSPAGRGFALLTPAARAASGRRGGSCAQRAGVAHQWTRAEAADAGRKSAAQRRAQDQASSTRSRPQT